MGTGLCVRADGAPPTSDHPVLRSFDHAPRPMRLEVLIVRASRNTVSPQVRHSDLPEQLTKRLRDLLAYDNFDMQAQAQLGGVEGENNVFAGNARGDEFVGELGDGTTNDAAIPIQVGLGSNPPLTNVTRLGGRTYFSLAVKSDGTIWGWGMNGAGQMGNARTPLQLNLDKNVQPGFVDLKWSSATGEYFAIEYTTDLAIGFTAGPINILATPPANTITVPATNGSCFYRLRF